MTIQSIALGARNRGLKLKQDFRRKLDRKIELLVASFFRWALSKHSVQREVARAFSGATPLCAVLEKAIDCAVEKAIDDHHFYIDADRVEGLDRAVERAIDDHHFYIDADSVEGLDRAIEKALDYVVESVVENHLRENLIDIKSIKGFEKAVTKILKENRNEIVDEIADEVVNRL